MEDAPNIDLRGGGGRLVYDKARRTIVSQPKETKMSDVMTFNNGLSPEQDDAIDDIMIDLMRINQRIEALGRHRSYSIAVTQVEQAVHWMRDRKHKAA